MEITVVYPARAHSAYSIAAHTFASLAKQVSDVKLQLLTDAQYTKSETQGAYTVLIGNDAVNPVVAELYLSRQIDSFGIRYGTDDYCIRTAHLRDENMLFLAGGRPRSALYAVYRYFEKFCNCRWFWDGDRISKAQLPFSGIDCTESPRFAYRGLRYFAHRSLHRFQAEHWSFEDWTTEIDWMLKKRLNFFMLRIGMDDLFQKAFPDIVPYPDRDKPLLGNGTGYDDRNLFWSLEYRGQLRKKILDYAFQRDLMHPEDCGPITHWYSRTPQEFLDAVQPAMLPQVNKNYNDPTGRVWDIRVPENFENYLKLTQTHIREYGNGQMFHSAGLGERMYSDDREDNKRMKLYTYRKFTTWLKENYPNAPIMLASWDLWQRFTPEEVQELVAELDPGQVMILDYTSDSVRENNFTRWGVVNKFPWLFGIFSGYEPNSEIRGFYELTNERLRLAKSDPMCKGAILWPELSHGDPLVIEYFAQNAWEQETRSVAEQVDRYCSDRYPAALVPDMQSLWRRFMPIVEMTSWNVDQSYLHHGSDYFPRIFWKAKFEKAEAELYRRRLAVCARQKEAAVDILKRLAQLPMEDALTCRDLYDIARTVIARFINAGILLAETLYTTGAAFAELEQAMAYTEALMQTLTDLLGTHEDYSLLDSLKRLQRVTDTNPNFEGVLKNNAECPYNRGYIYENAAYLYEPEMRLLFDAVKRAAQSGADLDNKALEPGRAQIRQCYFETPLAAMKRVTDPFLTIVLRAAAILEKMDI